MLSGIVQYSLTVNGFNADGCTFCQSLLYMLIETCIAIRSILHLAIID